MPNVGNDMMTLKNNKIMTNILNLIRMTRGTKALSEVYPVLKNNNGV